MAELNEHLPTADQIRRVVRPKGGGWTRMRGKDKGEVSRQTLELPTELWETIRRIAFWDRVTRSQVVNQAVRDLVAKLEKQRGESYAPIEAPPKMGRPIR